MKAWKKAALAALVLSALVPAALYWAMPDTALDLAVSIQRLSAGLARKQVRVKDHVIAFLEGGTGDTVVLVHGFGANKDLWNAMAYYLTPEYRVIAVDMPGFGESDKKETADYGFVSQAARLGDFLKKLGLDRFHLVGHSMGGAIAGIYAAKHSEKVLSITFIAAAGIKSTKESEYLELVQKGENPLLISSFADYERLVPFVYANPPWIPSSISRAVAGRAIAATPFNQKIFNDIIRENKDKEEYALGVVLPQIKSRSLILWGDRDRIMDVSSIPIMEARLRSSKTVIMKNCGHLPTMERPLETVGYLLNFLKEK